MQMLTQTILILRITLIALNAMGDSYIFIWPLLEIILKYLKFRIVTMEVN